ncbi:MAG TPA: hypothetical protein DEH78_17315 [Solibacterales bacterium]|nr:hypothetical protein [Bryobacterales bacterium]
MTEPLSIAGPSLRTLRRALRAYDGWQCRERDRVRVLLARSAARLGFADPLLLTSPMDVTNDAECRRWLTWALGRLRRPAEFAMLLPLPAGDAWYSWPPHVPGAGPLVLGLGAHRVHIALHADDDILDGAMVLRWRELTLGFRRLLPCIVDSHGQPTAILVAAFVGAVERTLLELDPAAEATLDLRLYLEASLVDIPALIAE